MKKLVLFTILFITTHAFAQTIPNPGFETWATSGPFLAPSGWGISPNVLQSTQAHSGSYALQCVVDTFTNPMTATLDTIPGVAYTGAQSMMPPGPGSTIGGYAFTGAPDSLTGYYKFQTLATDSFTISVILYYWDSSAGNRTIVGQSMFSSGRKDSLYSRFSMPVNYSSSTAADSALITIMSANPQSGAHLGTSLWVDDLAFISNTTAVTTIVNPGTTAKIFPNPFSDQLSVLQNAGIKYVTLTNILGQEVLRGTTETLNTSGLTDGIYFITITSADGSVTTQKVIKQ